MQNIHKTSNFTVFVQTCVHACLIFNHLFRHEETIFCFEIYKLALSVLRKKKKFTEKNSHTFFIYT